MHSNRRMKISCPRFGRTRVGAALLLALAMICAPATVRMANAQNLAEDDLYTLSRMVVFGTEAQNREALFRLRQRGSSDSVPGLILALRYGRFDHEVNQTLASLTGNRSARGWDEWMVWQQGRPEPNLTDSYLRLKLDVLARIDRRFNRFFNRPGLAHEIRLEEIAWRGLPVDGIGALTDPEMISAAAAAEFLTPDELILGVEIDGDARAYPLRILDWHEVINDVIGETPVTVAYCPLCGTGVLYATKIAGREAPLEFGSSGLVYRSTQLVYDRQTDSLWDLFSGRPVVGPLTGAGIELETLPIVMTRWSDWLQRHPDSRVLSRDTGFDHPYIPGAAHSGNANNPNPLFPVVLNDHRMAPKDLVFGIRLPVGNKAWPLDTFTGGRVLNDTIGGVDVVLIGDAEGRTVRAYRREGVTFTATASPRVLYRLDPDGPGEAVAQGGPEHQEVWRVSEEGLIGPNNAVLPRLPGLTAYWFAWSGHLGQGAVLYAPDNVPTD